MIPAYLVALFFLFSIFYSGYKIKNGDKVASFIYSWGFIIGAFVWEDLFVFSIYGFISSVATIYLNHWKFGVLFYLIFWFIRSAGETIYFFLQQFIVPKHYPHYIDGHFVTLRKIFGNISYQQCLILMQVFFQIILMTSAVLLIVLLVDWRNF